MTFRHVKSFNFLAISNTRVSSTLLKNSFRASQQAEIVNAGIQPVQNFAVLKTIISLGGDKMGHGKETIEKGFDALEKLVCEFGGKYSVGDELSIADLCLVPQVYNARRFKVDEKKYPRIYQISARLESLPAFIEAHPDNQVDAVF